MVSEPCKTCDSGSMCGQFSSLDLVYFGFSVSKPVFAIKSYLCVKIPVHLMLFSADYCRLVEDHVLLQTLGLQRCEMFEGEEQWLTLVESEVFEGILRVEDTWVSSLKPLYAGDQRGMHDKLLSKKWSHDGDIRNMHEKLLHAGDVTDMHEKLLNAGHQRSIHGHLKGMDVAQKEKSESRDAQLLATRMLKGVMEKLDAINMITHLKVSSELQKLKDNKSNEPQADIEFDELEAVSKSVSCMFQGGVLVVVFAIKSYLCVKIPVHLMLFSVDYCRSVEDHVLLQTLGLQSCEIFEGEEQWLTLVESEVFEGILRVEDTWASSLKTLYAGDQRGMHDKLLSKKWSHDGDIRNMHEKLLHAGESTGMHEKLLNAGHQWSIHGKLLHTGHLKGMDVAQKEKSESRDAQLLATRMLKGVMEKLDAINMITHLKVSSELQKLKDNKSNEPQTDRESDEPEAGRKPND
eukprot:Gb_35400 [translate_table: standard]